MPRILIADDHKIVRLGVHSILKSAFAQSLVIDEAENGDGVITLLRKHTYDLLILDVSMPETDSLALVGQVLAQYASQKIIMLSMNPENVFALRYIKCGARGYIEKNAPDEEIKKAIEKVLAGKKYMSADVMELIADNLSKPGKDNPFEHLSSREFEVARHLINGLSVTDIAELMSLHTSTIATHKSRLFEKLNIVKNIDLIRLAQLNNMSH
jgi:two-component system, NarL family, invasion response regulator UvrY